MVAGGNVNIIGTCGDDDGVSRVEIKINDRDYAPAEGTEFWSYDLITDSLGDGPVRITVRGVDVGGVAGDELSLLFTLDSHAPENRITSLENGSLVHGKIDVEGVVSDLNGIEKLEYSRDGGITYYPVSLKGKKRDPEKGYKITLDTRQMEEGPRVLWFRATDGTGTEGLSSFLLFVDNNPPEISLLYPSPDDRVNGVFPVAGYAADEIGLEKLTWKSGKGEPVDIPLREGDPYWTGEFDFTGEDRADITFELTDKAGNVSPYRLQMPLDREGDKPLLELVSPRPGETITQPVLAGFLHDDDGTAEVVYVLDGESPVTLPALFSFTDMWENLTPGKHILEIFSRDINGVKSNVQKIEFSYAGAEPVVRILAYSPLQGDGTVPFVQGGEIEGGLYKSLEGTLRFDNAPGDVTCSWDGGEAIKLSPRKTAGTDDLTFSLGMKDLMPGYHSLTVTAGDQAGLTGEKGFFFFLKGEGAASAEKKLYSGDNRFDSRGTPLESPVPIGDGDPLVFYLGDESAVRAELSGPTEFLSVQKEGHRVLVKGDSPGYGGDITLEMETASGKVYTIGPFSAVRDDSSPRISLDGEFGNRVYRENWELSGSVSDDTEVIELSLSMDGGTFLPLTLEEGVFSVTIDLSSLGEGDRFITLRALDRAGRTATEQILFRKDSTPPDFRQLTPEKDRPVNGVVTFSGLADGREGSIEREYVPGEGEPVPLEGANFTVYPMDLTEISGSAGGLFRLTDRAGNTAEVAPQILLDDEGDIPQVQIQIPSEGFLAERDFTVSGMAFDDDRIEAIFYSLDGGERVRLDGANDFEIPLSLSSLEANSHRLEVTAIDLNGVESDPAQLTFHVSRDEPVSRLLDPGIGKSVKGSVLLSGTSRDSNGISGVYLSCDNGNTFNRVSLNPRTLEEVYPEDGAFPVGEGEEIMPPEVSPLEDPVWWTYLLDTEILTDGGHSLLIRAVDGYGVSSLYTTMINVDNTPPGISLAEPAEGSPISGTTLFKGRAWDNRSLKTLKIDFQSLGGSESSLSRDLPLGGLIFEDLDLSPLEGGWVNMRITARDDTGNESVMSRNLYLTESENLERVQLLSPAPGASVTGDFLLEGRSLKISDPGKVRLIIDGSPSGDLELSENGYFHFPLGEDQLTAGRHTLQVSQQKTGGGEVLSGSVEIDYSPLGPWISLDSVKAGDFVSQRPWLSGSTGYGYPDPGLEGKEREKYAREREAQSVEISLDNGKTFISASGSSTWKFRLETQELASGELWILARAHFGDGATAVTKTLVLVDEDPPRIDLLNPAQEGLRFNGSLFLNGIGEDENGLDSISVALRKGSKNRYQVPSFIQGLYLDMHFLGATLFEAGAGLTFFDDNVKLQLQLGMSPPGRFYGFVSGMKLLANLAVVPWDYFLGYDFKDFSSSLAMGTVFDYFSMSESSPLSEDGLILAAMLTQIELVKWNNPDWNMFSSFAFYTEFQFWFISSDVDAGIEPRLTFGVRTDVF